MGGIAVPRAVIERFVADHGFSGFLSTSAKTGDGVSRLADAIRTSIDWEKLTEVVSTQLFTRIKRFLADEKERGDEVLVTTVQDLHSRFVKATQKAPFWKTLFGGETDPKDTLPEFRTCIGRLEAAGLIEILSFEALGEEGRDANHILMQPEYIDGYASAAIMTARNDPRGIGHVLEEDVLTGNLTLALAERISDGERERLVLAATVERLLEHDIALREPLKDGDYLVFPSQYTRTAPYPRTGAAGLAFDFAGPIEAIFTTLVVRLTHDSDFTEHSFYRDAACYETRNKGRCIVVLDADQRGLGRLSLSFEDDPDEAERAGFVAFVEQHLKARANPGSVQAHLDYQCPDCGYPWSNDLLKRRLARGATDILCPDCDLRTGIEDLSDIGELARDKARLISQEANDARERDLAATRVYGKEQIGHYDVFLSYNSDDREWALMLADILEKLALRPWIVDKEVPPGERSQSALEVGIQTAHSSAILVSPSGLGRWQELEMQASVAKSLDVEHPVIPVLLPGMEDEPDLSGFLGTFTWVDLCELPKPPPARIAELVAGIWGRRPGDPSIQSLTDQIAAMLQDP